MMDGRGRAAVDAVRRGARTASAAVSDGWREASTHMSGRVVSAGVASLLIGIVVLGEANGSPWWAPIVFVLSGVVAVFGVFQLSRYHPQVRH